MVRQIFGGGIGAKPGNEDSIRADRNNQGTVGNFFVGAAGAGCVGGALRGAACPAGAGVAAGWLVSSCGVGAAGGGVFFLHPAAASVPAINTRINIFMAFMVG